jgi:hypothetical protein
MMFLTLDNLAHRYNCLPSEALARGTTFDLYVLDISARYQTHLMEKEKHGINGAPGVRRMPTQEEMINMIKRVRGQE